MSYGIQIRTWKATKESKSRVSVKRVPDSKTRLSLWVNDDVFFVISLISVGIIGNTKYLLGTWNWEESNLHHFYFLFSQNLFTFAVKK